MNKKLLSILISLLLIISVFSVASFGDFGEFAGDSDWGYDSGSDWGGSDWDFGSSSDWDSDYGNGGYYYYNGGGYSGESEGGDFPLVLIVGIVIVVIVVGGVLSKSGMANQNARRTVTIQQPKPTEPLTNDIEKLKARDKNFMGRSALHQQQRTRRCYVRRYRSYGVGRR